MSHGRFRDPVTATLAGIKDVFGRQELEGRLTDDMRLDGRTCLVTGASSGVGYAAAVELARRGARMLTVSRSGIPDKGLAIQRESGSRDVEMHHTDLSDLAQVHALADTLRDRGERIHVLLDNAGVATPRAKRTPQGLDAMFVTNYLSKFVLANRLLQDGVIRNTTLASAPRGSDIMPRIVLISSDSHRGASAIDWAEFGTYADYGVNKGINNYSYFKLMLNTFAVELGRRLSAGGEIDVLTHVVCPGPVNTNIIRDAPPLLHAVLRGIFTVFFRSPVVAARPVAYACVAPEFGTQTLRYLHMFNPREMDEKCYDAAAGRRLWERSVELLRSVSQWRDD